MDINLNPRVRATVLHELAAMGGSEASYRGVNVPDRVSASAAGPIEMFTFGGDDTCVRIETGACV